MRRETNDVERAAARLELAIPTEHQADYAALLKKTDDACRAILAVDGEYRPRHQADHSDYKPAVDLTRWPRLRVHLPAGDDNPLRAWAWRADVGHQAGTNGAEGSLLKGKTVVLKDTVCLADVPLLFGTNAFEDYTRE